MQALFYKRFLEWVFSSPVGFNLCAGGSVCNWHVCKRNHTAVIVLAYVSQRDAAFTECQKRVIVRVQGHSRSSRDATEASRKSNVFSCLYCPDGLTKKFQ